MSSATEILLWIVGILIPVLIGALGWALVEIYQNLKEDIKGNAQRLDAYYTKLDGAHAMCTSIMNQQKDLKIRIGKLSVRTGDTTGLKARMETIGKKITETEATLKEQAESHGRVIQVLKKMVRVRESK